MAVVLTAPLALLALNLGLHWVVDRRPDLRDPIYYAKEDLLPLALFPMFRGGSPSWHSVPREPAMAFIRRRSKPK